MMGAKLIATSSKCSVRAMKKKKRISNSVDADFHAVKGHHERSTLQTGIHQPLPHPPSQALQVNLFSQDTMGAAVEMGRNLERQNEMWVTRNGANQQDLVSGQETTE